MASSPVGYVTDGSGRVAPIRNAYYRRNSDSSTSPWPLSATAGESSPMMMSTSSFDLGSALKAAGTMQPEMKFYRRIVYRPATSLELPGSTNYSLMNRPNASGPNSVTFLSKYRSVPGTPEGYYSTPREEMKHYRSGLIRPKTSIVLARSGTADGSFAPTPVPIPDVMTSAPSSAPTPMTGPPLLAPLPASLYPDGLMTRKKFADRPRTHLKLGGDWQVTRRNTEDFQSPTPELMVQKPKPFLPRNETRMFFYDTSRF